MLGSALGILPGGGAILASFASYSLEKKLSKTPEEFGQGAIEGVAGPEAANNAGAQTSFIPMLTLGIPANPVMALMIGALMIQGIQPGPTIITEQATLFWGVVVSMWIGNVFLLILNLPLIGLWVRMISVPYHLLYPAIMVFCAIGVFSISNTTFDVYLMALFGLLGYVFHEAWMRTDAAVARVHSGPADGRVFAPRNGPVGGPGGRAAAGAVERVPAGDCRAVIGFGAASSVRKENARRKYVCLPELTGARLGARPTTVRLQAA